VLLLRLLLLHQCPHQQAVVPVHCKGQVWERLQQWEYH